MPALETLVKWTTKLLVKNVKIICIAIDKNNYSKKKEKEVLSVVEAVAII